MQMYAIAYHKYIKFIKKIERQLNTFPESQDECDCRIGTLTSREGPGIIFSFIIPRAYVQIEHFVYVIEIYSALIK